MHEATAVSAPDRNGPAGFLEHRGITLHKEQRTVHVGQARIRFTRKEFDVLALLMEERGTTVTRERILGRLYAGQDEPTLKVIDVFVCKIRKKLNAALGFDPIETVWGRGYTIPL